MQMVRTDGRDLHNYITSKCSNKNKAWGALSMKAKGHRITTDKVMDLLDQLRKETGAWEFRLGEKEYKEFKDSIVEQSVETDELKDLELVDVDGGRDNPHKNELFENSDSARYVGDYDYIIYDKKTGLNFTAFNHFIDIKKGPDRKSVV